MTKKRSNVIFNNIKMDLNFNRKSPIIYSDSIQPRINEVKRFSKKPQT